MKITVLVENTPGIMGLEYEHGLSLYIETQKHKILFDTGQTPIFISNAKRLGIDLREVDTAFISHGHYDHGGGLAEFLKVNDKAKVYIRRSAFDNYYSTSKGKLRYIGLEQALKSSGRVILTDGNIEIDDELFLFTNVKVKKYPSYANKSLQVFKNGEYLQDNFIHEQDLVITEHNYHYLISGCSHCGPINIIDEFINIFSNEPDVYIGGLHLAKKSPFSEGNLTLINELAKAMSELSTKYYTLHCTGLPAFKELKKTLGDSLDYLATGDKLIFNSQI